MNSNYNTSITSNLLRGLGKSTRRGIKKCTKCGMYNGTRGVFCKNKQCGVSLKLNQKNHPFDYDAVKLITGTVRQVYSVRVKDKTFDSRGFVQLPLTNNALSDMALCFVDSCQRAFNDSILKCHEEAAQGRTDAEVCSHVDLAFKSQISAKPVKFVENVLDVLNVSNEMRRKLLMLAADSGDAPLVQRVSSNVMAVKCHVTPKQPLGYLHFTLIKGKNKAFEKYFCNCTDHLTYGCHNRSTDIKYKCVHYYACISALCSDTDYQEEFAHFIQHELCSRGRSLSSTLPKISNEIESTKVRRNKINVISNRVIIKPPEVILKKSTINQQKHAIKRCKKIAPKIYPIEIKVLNEPINNMTDNENDINWSFLDWLAFVTESINKTMQFINCGIINTQVFYIPEAFYVSLKQRIPADYGEQKSNIGSLYYSIMNVNHVKEIFDTPQVKLRIAKKFVHDNQSGYIECDVGNESGVYAESENHCRSCFIFFLNVGQSTVDESDNCNNPFIIEWMPNIFINTRIGQFKVQYKYGRKSI